MPRNDSHQATTCRHYWNQFPPPGLSCQYLAPVHFLGHGVRVAVYLFHPLDGGSKRRHRDMGGGGFDIKAGPSRHERELGPEKCSRWGRFGTKKMVSHWPRRCGLPSLRFGRIGEAASASVSEGSRNTRPFSVIAGGRYQPWKARTKRLHPDFQDTFLDSPLERCSVKNIPVCECCGW